MTRRKKSQNGKLLATVILVVGISLALISRSHYQARHPSAREARFVDSTQILARFAQKDLSTIRPGLPARISVGEAGYFATVVGPNPNDEKEFSLMLTGPNSTSPPPGTVCRVTVDASIPPAFLKPRSQPQPD